MGFLTYTGSRYKRFKKLNLGLAQIVGLILFMYMFFFGHHQITFAQTVHIPDPGLRAALELALGKEAGDDITRADMESLESLQASRCRFIRLKDTNNWGIPSRWICESPNDTFGPAIKKLTGLEYATNLTELHLGRNQISDVSPSKI